MMYLRFLFAAVLLLLIACDQRVGRETAGAPFLYFLAQTVGATTTPAISLYCGETASVTGSLGGWPGVRAMCQSACNNSATAHMCDEAATTRSLQFNKFTASSQAWVADPGWETDVNNGAIVLQACQGWTSSSGAIRGSIMLTNGRPSNQICSSNAVVACCDFVSLSALVN